MCKLVVSCTLERNLLTHTDMNIMDSNGGERGAAVANRGAGTSFANFGLALDFTYLSSAYTVCT